MKWLAFMETYCDRLDMRYPGEHARNVRRVLERFTHCRNLNERTVDEVNSLDLDQYVNKRRGDRWRGKELGNRTINNEVHILNAAFYKAGPAGFDSRSRRNYGFTEHPPAAEPLPELKTPPVELTPARIAAFVRSLPFAVCPQPNPHQFWSALFQFEFAVPLRTRGVLNLPRPENDAFQRGEFVLPALYNKEGTTLGDFAFRIPSKLIPVLFALPSAPGEPLFPFIKSNGKRYSVRYFSNVLSNFQQAAGLTIEDRITLKMIRSTVATRSADEFGDSVGRELLGHSPTTNTINTNYKRHRWTDRCVEASGSNLSMITDALER